jgi:micrococcal nuclease
MPHIQTHASAEDFTGKFVGVSDGDTLSVMKNGVAAKIRLHGIDAPERGQPFTNRAKQLSLTFATTRKLELRSRARTDIKARLPM